MRPRQNTMQCFHECMCGSIMRIGPKNLMQCPKCSLVLTPEEREDLLLSAYYSGKQHKTDGAPFNHAPLFGPYFKAAYRKGYNNKPIDFLMERRK